MTQIFQIIWEPFSNDAVLLAHLVCYWLTFGYAMDCLRLRSGKQERTSWLHHSKRYVSRMKVFRLGCVGCMWAGTILLSGIFMICLDLNTVLTTFQGLGKQICILKPSVNFLWVCVCVLISVCAELPVWFLSTQQTWRVECVIRTINDQIRIRMKAKLYCCLSTVPPESHVLKRTSSGSSCTKRGKHNVGGENTGVMQFDHYSTFGSIGVLTNVFTCTSWFSGSP